MIVATRQYGQLGNRLMLYAHLMAASIEYDVQLYFPHLREYSQYFPSIRSDRWCRYPQKSVTPASQSDQAKPYSRYEQFQRWLICKQVYLSARTLSHLRCNRFPAHVIRLADDQFCDLNTSEICEKAKSARPLLVAGWGFRSSKLVEKHADRIRKHFQILPAHRDNVDAKISELRRPDTKIVGVHIRHGDYRTWEDGKYFFPVEEYADHMRMIVEKNKQTNTRFLVCGNASLSKDDFPGLDVNFSSGHLIEDMYTLAETDVVIGPPSTYSGWSVFYGNTRMLTMMRGEDRLGLFDEAELHAAIDWPEISKTQSKNLNRHQLSDAA